MTTLAPSSAPLPSLKQTAIADNIAAHNIADAAVQLAGRLLGAAHEQQSGPEKKEAAQMARLMGDAAGKAFLFAMVDGVFRSSQHNIAARRWRQMLTTFGHPQYPSLQDRLMIRAGALASSLAPKLVMPAVAARMRADTSRVILSGETDDLKKYLRGRQQDGFRINLNHLGEAVMGEEEAGHRLKAILHHLAQPEVTYISVKISAIYSQINLLAWDDTLHEIKDRLRLLYRAALADKKFVNLDMEEYRDLALTIAAFQEVLDEPEFMQLPAGIVLQAYLPDSWDAQQELVAWAKERVARGGERIKIRLVKGANLAMETVEAEIHGWYPAPYPTKADTDANFRRMLEFGCQPENAAVARLGVASHNLFDVALALTLRDHYGVEEAVEIEMLEGMANHQARAVRDEAKGLLLYAPAVQKDDFLSAMAYLVRRLDENTSPDNFLHDLFGLQPGSAQWKRQKERFLTGWEERTTVSAASRRTVPAVEPEAAPIFENEPDSDWTQPATRDEVWGAIKTWQPVPMPPLAELEDVLQSAQQAQPAWEALGYAKRGEIMRRAGHLMTEQRFNAIACMRGEGKKAIGEADAEVSEAIDFARYYSETQVPEGTKAQALGIVAVTPPWNFPYAIPVGGVIAALMAGNSVIFKPAPETQGIAWLATQQLWEAGVPREVLQFFPCEDGDTGRALITDPRVASIVLTGALETARLFQDWRPSLRLFAETSGKNALVITAQADRELAIKDLVKSAFGHAGQKCSAASLAIIEAEVYDSPVFRRQLRDAAASLHVGPSEDARSVVTPLMRPPGEALERALTTLDKGESWLLEPHNEGDDPCQWSPGIKLGVAPGSWFHQTECFGPVLGLMRAESLEQAIKWQNSTPLGLTAGIHSLDEDEVEQWCDKVQAGNLYTNRQTTGAVVQRQPFGGWKLSSIGPGAKAGGPNYVFSFSHLTDQEDWAEVEVKASYHAAWRDHFSIEHDPSHLKAERNLFRYRPSQGVILRLATRDEEAIQRAQLAASLTKVPLTISIATEESDEAFATRLPQLAKKAEFLRTVATPNDEVLRAVYKANLNWIDAPLTGVGRLELRYWLREQAVTKTLHRYGQLSDAPDTAVSH